VQQDRTTSSIFLSGLDLFSSVMVDGTRIHHSKGVKLNVISYVAHPTNIATTAIVSLNPCAKIGAHKLRPDRR